MNSRKELFRALVGSHNYNLNTEKSDRDYKVFLIPNFDDLYFNNKIGKTKVGETEDFDFHDVRQLENLFWKSNVNFVEVLFSEKLIINKNLPKSSMNYLKEIIECRDKIAKMNLPYLYNACIGMCVNKIKLIDKGTESTKYLVEEYGYDTKQIMSALRILGFLRRFADNEFSDFKGAIYCKDNEKFREFLLEIKSGKYKKKEILDIYKYELNFIENVYKDKFLSKEPDYETKEKVSNLVKQIVFDNIKG